MNKVLAILVAGLFAAGAHAQNPTGTAPEQTGGTGTGRAAATAQAKSDTKAHAVGKVAGDQGSVAEGSGGVTKTAADKSAQARRDSRDARRPAKNGGKKPVPMQGGTPDMPGAK